MKDETSWAGSVVRMAPSGHKDLLTWIVLVILALIFVGRAKRKGAGQ